MIEHAEIHVAGLSTVLRRLGDDTGSIPKTGETSLHVCQSNDLGRHCVMRD